MIGIISKGYSVKVSNFEGPLDLLLELIQNAKMKITEISLAEITDQYISYLKTFQYFNIDIASEFFVIAATLIFIKTKNLIPSQKNEEDELVDEKELIMRLKEYKKFKILAHKLEKIREEGDVYYPRGYSVELKNMFKQKGEFNPLVGELLEGIIRYKGAFLKRAIPIKRREVNIEEKMKKIIEKLEEKKMVLFSELAKEEKTKIDKVATFLGGLELSFRQKVLLNQLKLFSDIEIEKKYNVQEEIL